MKTKSNFVRSIQLPNGWYIEIITQHCESDGETDVEDIRVNSSGDNLAHNGEVTDGETENEADGEEGENNLPGLIWKQRNMLVANLHTQRFLWQ